MAHPLSWLLSLLLLLLPSPLREYLISSIPEANNNHHAGAGGAFLHPIVLFPGFSCSDLEARLTEEYRPSVPRCGARKGEGWFGLWENTSDIVAHDYAECFQEQMHLVYDPAADDYRNLPGVETRVPNFGSATGFHHKDPLKRELCLGKLRETLEGIGYRDGETLFGASYDMRRAPPVPGQTSSQVYSRYFEQVTRLVEDASAKSNGAKVILFGHSYGGLVALEFVRSTPLAWRHRFIEHLFMAAPTPSQGFVAPVQNLVSGPADQLFSIPTAPGLSLRPMWWSFESAVTLLPSAKVFGRAPLVVTGRRNYSAHDMEELMVAIGFGDDGVRAFRRRALPQMTRSFQAPLVPVTCFNGAGIPTPRQLVYWDHDFDAPPQLVYGDGDGMINSIGMLAFDVKMRQHPVQRRQYKSLKFDKARHETVVSDDWVLKKIIQEILHK